jgi:SPP1 gp7 family putative phage head morphogenesis protein
LNELSYTDKEIEDIINRVYGGSVSRDVLPVELYNDVKNRLNKAVFEGFGGSYAQFDTSTTEGLIMAGFEKNIAVFSGAKTFQQVNDMSNILYSGVNGSKIPFNEFKAHANEIFDTYNNNWLKTEYNTALSQASAGRQWSDIEAQKDILPLIKYLTVGDGRVRDKHIPLDGVVYPVEHPFWNENFPANDWNCRCITEQLMEGEEPTTDENKTFPENPELFRMNAGKDKIIFREDVHPYLKVSERYQVALQNNFDLPFVPEVKVKVPRAPRVPKLPKAPKVPAVPEAVPVVEQTAQQAAERIKNLPLVKEAAALDVELAAGKEASAAELRAINLINYRTDPTEYSRRVNAWNADLRARKKLVSRKKLLLKKAETDIIDILKVEDHFEELNFVSLANSLEKKPKLIQTLDKFKTFFSKKWQPENLSVNIYVKPRVRANFIGGRYNRVTLSPTDGTETILHELGHFLEHDRPELHSQIMEFYNKRTVGDKLERLRDVTGNKGYELREITKKDNFVDPYIGRFYNEAGASEVLTMWFTEVFNNPTRLMNKDFEYFEFIYKLLRQK